jgi:hypothetical protein
VAWWNRRQPKGDTAREYVRAWTGEPETPATRTVSVLTAAASALKASQRGLVISYSTWQEEVWGLYDTLGEFGFATEWKSEMTSRVRLRAAEKVEGQDEPSFVDDGPAAELVEELGGGVGGRSALLSRLSTLLSVPGEGYLVGESSGGTEKWLVYSTSEIRARGDTYEVIDESSTPSRVLWRPLASNSLIVRIHRPHKRLSYLADSPANRARSTMRELELVNRKIQAQYLSRLASAGLVIIPSEVQFPVREEFQDSDDPFMQEWIETAAEAIRTPGTAASVVPIPMRIPGEYADKVKFIDFTLALDDKLIEKRESAIKRLATQLDLPAEVLLGMADLNHWTAWQISEEGVKAHISPDVELIVHALTTGYLHPRLKAMGEDPDKWCIWYDASEIVQRPDKSDVAVQVFDRIELSGEALRRETGFDEDDAPSDEEVREQILRKVAGAGTQFSLTAMAKLFGEEIFESAESPEADAEPAPEEPEDDDGPAGRGPPDTRDEPPPPPGDTSTASGVPTPLELRQATAMHHVDYDADGWTLRHPQVCIEHLFSCPVEHAWRRSLAADIHPGTPGEYECWLSLGGDVVTGPRAYGGDFVDGSSHRFGGRGNGARNGTVSRQIG